MALSGHILDWQDGVVFTRSFAEITEPFEAVEAALLRSPRTWLPGANGPGTEPSPDSGEIQVHIGAAGLTKNVSITLGQPSRRPTKTSIPVSWQATGPSGLFPQLAGILEISRFGPRQTLLALLVEYQPPLGRLGEVLDDALLHRIAWATVSAFGDGVAEALAAQAHSKSAPSGTGSNP
jgi:hypothetical protein